MQSFNLDLEQELFSDFKLFASTLQPICDLISLYGGPSLSKSSLELNSALSLYHARGLKEGFAFTYNLLNDNSAEFGYFKHGEKLLAITKKQNDSTLIETSSAVSKLVEVELRKALSRFIVDKNQQKQSEEKVDPKSNDTSKSAILETIKFFTTQGPTGFHSRFIPVMNDVCTLISNGEAPQIKTIELVFEDRESSRETFYRLEKSENNYRVFFEDYTYDTGHYANTKGGHIKFEFYQNEKLILHGAVGGGRLHLQLIMSLKEKFEPKIIEMIEGKI